MLYGLYEDHPDASSDQASQSIVLAWLMIFLQSVPINPSLTDGMSGIIKSDDKMQQHLKSG